MPQATAHTINPEGPHMHNDTANSLLASAAALRALAATKKFRCYAAACLAAAFDYEAQALATLAPDQGGQVNEHFAA